MAYSSTLKMETVCFSEYIASHPRRWYSSKYKLPKNATNTRYKILTDVLLKIQVFWDVVPCQSLNRCQCFYGLFFRFHPAADHKGPEGEYRYSSTLS
jgi:hypothetical protein